MNEFKGILRKSPVKGIRETKISRLNEIFTAKSTRHKTKKTVPTEPDYHTQFDQIQVSQPILKYLQDPHISPQIKTNFITTFQKIASMNITELIREQRKRTKEFHTLIHQNQLNMKQLSLFQMDKVKIEESK